MNVIIYMRRSKVPLPETASMASFVAVTARLHALALERGATSITTYYDVGPVSRSMFKRPGFRQLIRHVLRSEVSVVLASKLTRLSRLNHDLVEFACILGRAGVDLWTLREGRVLSVEEADKTPGYPMFDFEDRPSAETLHDDEPGF